MNKALVLIVISCLVACTNEDLYDMIQAHNVTECEKESASFVRENCLQQSSTAYDDYKQQRDTLLSPSHAP